ncbi:type II toxin-antitoxin system YafQ family toxin [Lancefieldella parvula]|nr:type II toxin-antitoxin system YafQ family toxin [Lancefieldella parvula]
MLELKFTAKFKKDYKRAQKQGKDLEKLEKILEKLVYREELPKYISDL